jgi:hypothetical protein
VRSQLFLCYAWKIKARRMESVILSYDPNVDLSSGLCKSQSSGIGSEDEGLK